MFYSRDIVGIMIEAKRNHSSRPTERKVRLDVLADTWENGHTE